LPAFDENTKVFEDQLFGANFPAKAALLGLFEARGKSLTAPHPARPRARCSRCAHVEFGASWRVTERRSTRRTAAGSIKRDDARSKGIRDVTLQLDSNRLQRYSNRI
jgi:hypothetical protein